MHRTETGTRPRRTSSAGFSLVELMVVLVIIAVLATLAVPLMGRDNRQIESQQFAAGLARELQRARTEAVGSRLPVRVWLFSDRIEFRQARPGAGLGDPPIQAIATDPIIRIAQTKNGVTIFDIRDDNALPSIQTLSPATAQVLHFSGMGDVRLIAAPTAAGPGARTTAAQYRNLTIFVRNTMLPAGHPYRDHRLTLTALTGQTDMRPGW